MKGMFKDFFEFVFSKIRVYQRLSVVKKIVKKQSLREGIPIARDRHITGVAQIKYQVGKTDGVAVTQ